jgi:tetratricopeptide (TPR) repeat protein
MNLFNRAILLVLLMVFLVSIPGCDQTSTELTFTTKSSKAHDLFLEGLEKSDNAYRAESRALFGEAVKEDPEFAIAYCYWGLISPSIDDSRERLKKAVNYLDNATYPEQLIIKSAWARINDSLAQSGKYLEELVTILPDCKRAHFLLGVHYFARQEWEKSEQELMISKKLAPSFAAIYNMLGYIYINQERYPEAIEALKKYAKLRPNEPNPHDSMGEIYLALGDYDKSIEEYNKSLSMESDFVYSMAGIGHNYLFMGEFDKARDAYDDIFRRAKSIEDTNLAYTCKMSSYIAEEKYEDAINVASDHLELVRSITDIFAQFSIHLRKASVYYFMDDLETSLEEVGHAREITDRPDMQPGLNERHIRQCLVFEITIMTRLGKRDEANAKLAEYRESIMASGDMSLMRDYYGIEGIIAFWNKDYETAIRKFEETNPLDQYFKYYLGLSYLKSGQAETAKQIFTEIAQFNRYDFMYTFIKPKAEKLI